jgi:hypothetical protein
MSKVDGTGFSLEDSAFAVGGFLQDASTASSVNVKNTGMAAGVDTGFQQTYPFDPGSGTGGISAPTASASPLVTSKPDAPPLVASKPDAPAQIASSMGSAVDASAAHVAATSPMQAATPAAPADTTWVPGGLSGAFVPSSQATPDYISRMSRTL